MLYYIRRGVNTPFIFWRFDEAPLCLCKKETREEKKRKGVKKWNTCPKTKTKRINKPNHIPGRVHPVHPKHRPKLNIAQRRFVLTVARHQSKGRLWKKEKEGKVRAVFECIYTKPPECLECVYVCVCVCAHVSLPCQECVQVPLCMYQHVPRKWKSPGKSQIWNWTKGLLGINLISKLCYVEGNVHMLSGGGLS